VCVNGCRCHFTYTRIVYRIPRLLSQKCEAQEQQIVWQGQQNVVIRVGQNRAFAPCVTVCTYVCMVIHCVTLCDRAFAPCVTVCDRAFAPCVTLCDRAFAPCVTTCTYVCTVIHCVTLCDRAFAPCVTVCDRAFAPCVTLCDRAFAPRVTVCMYVCMVISPQKLPYLRTYVWF
jgi:hypothetical protein